MLARLVDMIPRASACCTLCKSQVTMGLPIT